MESENKIRSSREVAERAIVLYCVVESSDSDDRVELRDWLKTEKLWSAVSPIEKKLFGKGKITQQQIINASWRVEALETIVWSLNLLPTVTPSTDQCDPSQIKALFPFFLGDTKDFLSQSKLRTDEEIEKTLEEIYEQHWKVRDAMLNHKDTPDNLDSGVIKEKHHALNWVTGYEELDWDNVSTDT